MKKKLEKVGKGIVLKYHRYKYYHKLFINWTNKMRQLSHIKMQALNMVKNHNQGTSQKSRELSEFELQEKFNRCSVLLYDQRFSGLQGERDVIIRKIKLLENEIYKAQIGDPALNIYDRLNMPS